MVLRGVGVGGWFLLHAVVTFWSVRASDPQLAGVSVHGCGGLRRGLLRIQALLSQEDFHPSIISASTALTHSYVSSGETRVMNINESSTNQVK